MPCSKGYLHLLVLFATAIHLVSAQNGDGGGASGIQPGDIGSDPSASGAADAGAGGSDSGAVNLSKGATIAIGIVVGIVVVLGTTSAVLFYLAKKRQWQVRASIRRTASRVTTGITRVMTPRTPQKMTFSPVDRRRNGSEGADLLRKKETNTRTSQGDLEKALPQPKVDEMSETRTPRKITKEDKDSQKKRPIPPRVSVPQSSFEMESPKTPLWSKVFGR